MEVDPPRVTVHCFYDAGHTRNKTMSPCYSTDSGANFKSVTISEAPFIPGDKSTMGTYLSITAAGGIITPIWSRTHEDKTSLLTVTIRQEELVKPVVTEKGKKKK